MKKLLVLLMLSGCGPYWTRDQTWELKSKPTIYEVGRAGAWCQEVPRRCAAYDPLLCEDEALGCAIRHPWDGTCTIFITKNSPEWVLQHELRHCDGWDHPI